MTAAWETPATAGQLAELRRLAETLGQDLPVGLRRNEAAQRIDEWRRHVLANAGEIDGDGVVLLDADLAHIGGGARPVEDVFSPLL